MKPNKKVRLYVNGERQKDVYIDKTKWQIFKFHVKKFFKRLFWLLVIGFIAYSIFKIGGIFNPSIVYTRAEVIKEVEPKAPVLERIAKCESGNQHFKNGQVLVNGNKNGSVDVGRYQINSLWFSKATELGLNLMVEKDNEIFARYLYKQYGSEPWIWTKSCWNK